MYERSYGYKYQDIGDHPSAAELAKAMRADIKLAVSEGLLPGKPVVYSVTSDTYAGGCSVDITVKGWSEGFYAHDAQDCPRGPQMHPGPQCLTPEVEAAKMTLDRIHNAYNHDGSETQTDYFDVRYYGQVSFESPDTAAWRQAEKAKKQARRQAIDEALNGPRQRIVNYGRGGTHTVHDAVEVDGKLRLVCGAQLWRGSLTSPTTSELTCTRCAKKARP